ncbi:MAG: glycogen debranching protein GlgX [Dongiaceae bacterium]
MEPGTTSRSPGPAGERVELPVRRERCARAGAHSAAEQTDGVAWPCRRRRRGSALRLPATRSIFGDRSPLPTGWQVADRSARAALHRRFKLTPSMFGYNPSDSRADLSFSTINSAPDMPKAIVTAIPESTAASARPRVPWQDTIIYEMHVKGFTRLDERVPERLRGTLAGLAQPAALDHLAKLGITTIELMPIAAFIDERHLPPLGLTNYWGYNPVTFLAPDPRYVTGDAIDETRAAIQRIRERGIEVLLDVVFNHTGESDELGPTICYRGIDNAAYYRLRPDDRRRYDNVTGCGNSLAVDRPPVLRLVMDAMRHWATAIGVDGFRFDLATTLARNDLGYDRDGPFLTALRRDPVISDLKLIVEPWDLGPGGYQGGAFPAGIAEWNDQFRDDVRRFWQGTSGGVARLATRLSGSSDHFRSGERLPSDSINFITAHDGFSLADLVSYEHKHNNANGEHNGDGTNENFSWNHGVEGPAADPAIAEARRRDLRALLATLLLARGTPMLRSGDELGQTQSGNNNAYAQDNAVTWIDWSAAEKFADLTALAQRLIGLRKEHPALHANRFLEGRLVDGAPYKDGTWRREDGHQLGGGDWDDAERRFIALELYDSGATDHLYLIANGGEAATATLPPVTGRWKVLFNSTDASCVEHAVGVTLRVSRRSVVLLADDPHAPPMEDPGALERLANLANIEPEHRDANGHDHIVSAETKRALLAAMGLPADNPSDLRDSLRLLELGPWRTALPPFIIVDAGRPFAIDLIVDRAKSDAPATLAFELESGERRHVQVIPGHGQPIEERRDDGAVRSKWRVPIDLALPIGLHRVTMEEATATIAATPGRAWEPGFLASGGKCWGVSSNLYAARSARDWGIGDFSTLREIVEAVGKRGGALVGINPLHALFPARPEQTSPYYPSDRRFLESAYIDPETMPDFDMLAASDSWFQRAADTARDLHDAALIDYGAVFKLKRQAFDRVWTWFRERHMRPGDPLGDEFRRFIAAGGQALKQFAAFQVASLREADSHLQFHMFLQWWADRSLAAAAKSAPLAIGLYRDLAVGPAPDGAELITGRDWFARKVSVGAPPDPYSDIGQVWGVPPFNPIAVAERRFEPWIELMRANMRHAGALRLDHVMGLERLLWVPEGATANDGAYVKNDAAALLAILAIESHRNRCMVVGEDLGTVPSGFRERMERAGLFSMRVMLFERDGATFRASHRYPPQSVASFGTHDLPPFLGWWGKNKDGSGGEAMRAALSASPEMAAGASDDSAVSVAMHGFLGASSAKVALAQFDDLAQQTLPVNVPGTTTEHPNWRRRLGHTVQEVFASSHAKKAIDAIAADRSVDG